MTITHTDNAEQLAWLIERLIKVVRYDNKYAYQLLKKATLGKVAVIQLDDSRISIAANESEADEYFTVIHTKDQTAAPVFSTTSPTLKKILSGVITLDKAIADHELYVQGTFSEVLDVYRLALCLLTDGPMNPNLRRLWEEFTATWNPAAEKIRLQPVENQIARYNILVDAIPGNVLNVGLCKK